MKQKANNTEFGLYRDQVGGHHCIISYKDYILKPYNHHESYMYTIIPHKFPQMEHLLPKYYGVVDLSDLNLIDLPDFNSPPPLEMEKTGETSGKAAQEASDTQCGEQATGKDRWLNSLFRRRFDSHNTRSCSVAVGFIQIQNLAARLKRPCVLDVKIGLGKPKAEKKLAAATEQLKFRICGMSVYQVKTGAFLFRDKYWGRKLPVHELKNALALFFYNGSSTVYNVGEEINTTVLRKFIKLLEKTYSCIRSTKGIRLVSSSLLLVYDAMGGEPRLKLIDFENVEETNDAKADTHSLEGIDNACKILKEIEEIY